MSVGGFQDRNLAVKSGIDSVSEGVKATQTDPTLLKGAIDAFSKTPHQLGIGATKDGMDAGKLQRAGMPDSGHVGDPHKFFSKLSLTPSFSAGKFQASELAKKLLDPGANMQSDLKALSETFGDNLKSMGDLSQEMQMKMQMAMERFSKLSDMVSNFLKKMNSTESDISRNLK